MGFWLLFFLIVLWFAAVPWWPYSRPWGYWPSNVLVLLALLWLLLLWMGFFAFYWPWTAPVPITGPVGAPG